jgi:lysine 2,3-aminomutase
MLARHNPLYVLTHFNHPAELTSEAVIALRTLSDHGLPLANQTVLLAGVNDQVEIIESLCRMLLSARVRPYYLHQCDLTLGTGHFRTPLSTGLEIMRALRAGLSGLAVPTFAVDLPQGRGKVALEPQHLTIRGSGRTVIRDAGGQFVDYPDVVSTTAAPP